MATSTRKCTACKDRFKQDLSTWTRTPAGWFHEFKCAIDYSNKKTKAQEKREWAKRKEVLRGIPHQNELTQAVVNTYVRLRDKASDRPCVSCGKKIDYVTKVQGGTHDAGHYKSVGACSELRFNVANINVECKHCNHYDDKHLVGMRKEIVKRYGKNRLKWLDSHHDLNNYTIYDHKRLRKLLRLRLKRYIK